jgi:hypothetical protein
MMCIVHYISALRRLKESKKTVMMLGGEEEAPPMIVAQCEMIQWEMEYYQDECVKFGILSAIVAALLIPVYLYHLGVI